MIPDRIGQSGPPGAQWSFGGVPPPTAGFDLRELLFLAGQASPRKPSHR